MWLPRQLGGGGWERVQQFIQDDNDHGSSEAVSGCIEEMCVPDFGIGININVAREKRG